MILVGWATAGIGQDWTGAAQAPEGGQLLRGHQQGGLLGSLEGGRTGAAATARRAPEGYGVGNMTGAHQAPEGWGQGWTSFQMQRAHLLGRLHGDWTGAAAMQAAEGCGVGITTGAHQAPEGQRHGYLHLLGVWTGAATMRAPGGQGHGWAWVGWDMVTCLVHRRVNGMGVLAE